MQSISPLTTDQMLARGKEPLLKVEIYVDTTWIDLCDLDGKNYVEDDSVSLGGASMTPNPIGGKWSVVLLNKDSIFHPKHPTSPYKDYIKTGRKTRISKGAKYGGTDYYWQRVIGFMDEPRFDMPNFKVDISGADYMKFLQDTELRSPDNYWGADQTFNSLSSGGIVGSEIYTEADAMDILNEGDNVDGWTPSYCTFEVENDTGGGSTLVGKAFIAFQGPASVINIAVGAVVAGKEYIVKFKYRKTAGEGEMDIHVLQNGSSLGGTSGLCMITYTEGSFRFVAASSGSVKIQLGFMANAVDTEFRVDQFSIFEFVPYHKRYYELPAACKDPYRVVLDDEDVWQGEGDEDWEYQESTRRVSFNINKEVANGTNNLKIYYFTTQAMEDVVADLLVTAGLYADRAAALTDMDYTDPAIDIDRVWFKAGKTCLNAIKKICERCDYRFHFRYDGKPVFKPKPAPETTAFTFTDQKHITSANPYQDRNEIRNRIVIKGEKQADPASKEETMPSELKGEAYDQDSIDEYGERTLTINNHLFQDQASIDAMVASLLAERKDPQWYAKVDVPFNPVPLELGDKISWKGRLSPILEITQAGMIRDMKINNLNMLYVCELES